MKKIRVAFIYKKSYVFLSGNYFDNTTFHFFMNALKRNNSIEMTYFPSGNHFDVLKLKNKFDVILLPNNNVDGTPNELSGIKGLDIPVICRTGDPHFAKKYNQFVFHEKWKIDYYFNFMHKDYFYRFYPKNFKYKTIIFGVEPSLYQNLTPFKNRMKNKILNSGAIGNTSLESRVVNRILNPKKSGWYFYKLRTLCNKLPYVDYSGMNENRYTNDEYPAYLSRYRASIAATTFYPTIKYWESAAAGCLTFMEITKKNMGDYLGYKDGDNAIFINEKNYKDKFEEYLNDPDNYKWEKLAFESRRYTLENFSNDEAAKSLVELMKSLT